MKRVGFIIGKQLDEIRLLHPNRIPDSGGASGQMRFGWIADVVNRESSCELRYEVYRPWRRYDAVVFMKAMGPKCMTLLRRFQRRGVLAVFDANVNYYETEGHFHYEGMAPTPVQTRDAEEITRAADAVIADSPYLARLCRSRNPNTCWIPDNVDLSRVPEQTPWNWSSDESLPLIWSGQASKLFELLAIEDILREYRSRVRLLLVTNSFDALDAWRGDAKDRFLTLLQDIPHEVMAFQSIEHLLSVYAQGGVCLSPRFLDNSYNMGHTEWKISLGMAAGCMVLCSPVPSYVAAAGRAERSGVRICASPSQWQAAFDDVLAGRVDPGKEGAAARRVVEEYYATEVVAAQHVAFTQQLLGGGNVSDLSQDEGAGC